MHYVRCCKIFMYSASVRCIFAITVPTIIIKASGRHERNWCPNVQTASFDTPYSVNGSHQIQNPHCRLLHPSPPDPNKDRTPFPFIH